MAQITLEEMLKPISEKSPCGDDIRNGDVYEEIQEARREDDPTLPQGVWKTELKRAEWGKIITLSEETLARKSKDLQIVAWYTEAKLKKEGMRGLVAGVKLFGMLSDIFWETLHPLQESDESDERLHVLDWLNERLPERIYEMEIAHKVDQPDNYTFGEWAMLSKNQKVEANKVRYAKMRDAISSMPWPDYETLKAESIEAQKCLDQLNEELSKHDKRADGSFYKLKKVISELQSFAEEVLRDICVPPKKEGVEVAEEAAPAAAPANEEKAENPAPKRQAKSSGAITTRKEAYEQLNEVLKFLAEHEPHNPAHYLLRKVLNWADLELGEIMKEIMQHPQFYQSTFDQFGGRSRTTPPAASAQPNAPLDQPQGGISKAAAEDPNGFYPIQPSRASMNFGHSDPSKDHNKN